MWIVGDGFDYYGAPADLAKSVWDSYAGGVLFAAGRFGVGQSFRFASGVVGLQKTIGSNEGTLFAALAYYRDTAQSGTTAESWVQFRDGATNQCTVVFQSNGSLVLKSGSETGTVLATYPAAYGQDVWTHFQIKVVIHNTTGSITVRKNGSTTDSFSATGLNTRGGTANNYATVVLFGMASLGGMQRYCDDLLFYSGSGAAPNDWIGDVRALPLYPSNDTAVKQMTPSFTSLGVGTGGSTAGSPLVANTLYYGGPWSPARGGPLTKLSVAFAAGYTGSVQCAIYAADGPGGFAGTLLETTAAVTNPVSGSNDFACAGTLTLSPARAYWLAVLPSVAMTLSFNGVGPQARYSIARTYASGFPNPGSVTGTTGPSTAFGPYATLTLSGNVVNVSEGLANGDTDYVSDGVVGHQDLYDLADLAAMPTAIIAVVSKIYVKKSDAGARSGQLQVKSGATQVGGADTVLATTYVYLSRVDPVDPATGVAWTIPGVNALQLGQKVTA